MTRDDAIKASLASGLFSVVLAEAPDTEQEPYFSHYGCDVCAIQTGKRLGATVQNIHGYASLKDAREIGDSAQIEFTMCGDCLCEATNG